MFESVTGAGEEVLTRGKKSRRKAYLGDGGLLVEGESGVNLGGDSAGDESKDLLSELDELRRGEWREGWSAQSSTGTGGGPGRLTSRGRNCQQLTTVEKRKETHESIGSVLDLGLEVTGGGEGRNESQHGSLPIGGRRNGRWLTLPSPSRTPRPG